MASLKDLIVMGPARFLDKLYGNLEGNATSATKLATARTINGTSFDGSSNITTANWGTARTITIGATGKSVNGSTNYSWSPYEMRVTRAQYGVDTSMNVIADNGCELGMASLSSSDTTINPGGGTGWHHYINMTWTDCADNNGSTINEWCTQIANKVGSTDLWVRSRSGGSITDGTAWVAPWTRILTGSNYTNVLDSRYLKLTGGTVTGAINITTNGVTNSFYSQNSSFTHYSTSASTGHWFNKAVYVQGNIYAGSSYSDLVLTTANYSGYLDPRYVNVSGDTMTDTLYFSNTGATSGVFKGIRGIMADNDYWRVGGSQTATNAGYLEIATGDDGNEPIYVRQYSGAFSSLIRTATLLDGSGNTTFPGKVTANNMYTTTGVYYGREATIPLLVPAYIDFEYSHVDSTNTSGDDNFRKGAIKLLCQNNRGLGNVNVFGAYHPNSQGPLIGQIYNTSTVDSTTGLPQYSTFWGSNLAGSIEIFGTSSYNYYHRTVLDSSNYTSYTVKKDGTGASGTWGISITGSAGSVAWGNVTGKPSFNYLPLAGGTLSGLLSAHGGISLNNTTPNETPSYILGIRAFADGGNIIWQTASNVSVGYATSAGSVAWGNVTGKPSTFAPSTHYHNILTAGGEGSTASVRSADRSSALITGGWGSTSAGYLTQYGTTLDVSGYSTWYHRLAFNTNGIIEYWQGINTKTLTRVGYLYSTQNIIYSSTEPTAPHAGAIWLKPV